MHYLPPPESGSRSIPFRWIFPFGQLVLSLFLLVVLSFGPLFLVLSMRHVVAQGIAALNMPGLLLQVPEAILRADHSFWTPPWIDRLIWQAFRASVVGMFFWWISGRATEALVSITYQKLKPRITWAEAIVGLFLVAAGATILVGGLVFGTHADRADAEFRRLAAAGGLWALLGAMSVIACFRQWRLRKRTATSQPSSVPVPQ